MYAIVGATGNTGKVVAETLLAAGKDVRVIGRSAERLRAFVDKGAEAFIGSVEEPQEMARAFSGATAAYCLIPPRFEASDFRAYQRTVGEAITAGLRDGGVENVVFLSSVGAQHTEGTGPITGLRAQEDRLNGLEGVNVLSLRAGWFMENFFMSIGTIREMGIIGTPVDPDVRIAMIAARDIGEAAVAHLLELDFSGKSARELLGQRDITLAEATAVIGGAIGKDLEYVQFPYEDAERALTRMGVGASAAGVFIEMYRAFNEGRVVPTEERSARNTTPTSIEDFARFFAQLYSG